MINPEIASNPVTINGITIDRQDLEDMDKALRRYHTNRDRVSYLRKRIPQITQESSAPADGMPRGSDVSNPTLAKVEKMEHLEEQATELDAWLSAVANVRRRLAPLQQQITDHLYFLPYVERETNISTLAKALHMSRKELYRTLDEALLEFWLVLHE